MFALLLYDVLSQGSSQQFEIKQKYPCRSRLSQHLHNLFFLAFLCSPDEGNVWKHCTNKHTVLINILCIAGWQPCWLP